MEGFNDLVEEEYRRLRPQFDKAKATPIPFYTMFENLGGTPGSAGKKRALAISMRAEKFAEKLLAQNPSLSIRMAIARIMREEIADPNDMRFDGLSVSGTADYDSQIRLGQAYKNANP